MQSHELVDLINKIQTFKCEFQNIEVKLAKDGCPTKLYDTLSSFSNQDGGGIIVFGLDEKQDFKAFGVYDIQDLQHKVAEQCKQMQPAVRPLFSVCEFQGLTICACEVPGVDISERPVYYKGIGRSKGSYIRVGDSDEQMSNYEIYSYSAYHRRLRDDIRVAEFSNFSQLNTKLLSEYLEELKENKVNLQSLADDEILELMGITNNGIPTLSGVLCFSKYPQAVFPQLCITAVVIPGTSMGEIGAFGERFIDNQRIEGTIKEMLETSISFVKRNMKVKTIINSDGMREDRFEYPIVAIREGILNALMHRDYSIHTEGVPIRIEMYSDRIEIISVGGLYGRLTIDKLGKVHADTRNQTLTNILEIQKVAENRYSGIPSIKLAMKKIQLPSPVFDNTRGNFVLKLYNDLNAKSNSTSKTSEIALTNHTDNEIVTALKSGSELDLNAKILDFCIIPKTRAEISEFIGKTQYYTVKTLISPLVQKDELKMTLPDKPRSKNQKFYSNKQFGT